MTELLVAGDMKPNCDDYAIQSLIYSNQTISKRIYAEGSKGREDGRKNGDVQIIV